MNGAEIPLLVVNLTSVLQIAFGVNFLFFIMEVKPLLDQKWQGLDSEYDPVLQRTWHRFLVSDSKHSRFLFQYAQMTLPRVLYIGIEAVAFVLSAVASIVALSLLIEYGFYPDLTIARENMVRLCFLFFGTVPAYYLLSQGLIAYTKRKFVQVHANEPSESPKIPAGLDLSPPFSKRHARNDKKPKDIKN